MSTAEYNPKRWVCSATGCPLSGAINASPRGATENWFCRFHFQRPITAAAAITKVLYETQGMSELEIGKRVDRAIADARRDLFTDEEAYP